MNHLFMQNLDLARKLGWYTRKARIPYHVSSLLYGFRRRGGCGTGGLHAGERIACCLSAPRTSLPLGLPVRPRPIRVFDPRTSLLSDGRSACTTSVDPPA